MSGRRCARPRFVWAFSCCVGIVVLWAAVAGAARAADTRPLRLISTPHSGSSRAFFVGASKDGTRVFFQTNEKIPDTGDNNDRTDIYERDSDGTLHLVSTGDQDSDAAFDGASADGTRVFFTTNQDIPGTGDQDFDTDVYERDSDGTLHLIGTGNQAAFFDGASDDGTHVFFDTAERIPGTGDNNNITDVYERDSDGTLRLVSSGDQQAPGAFFEGVSADGTRVFYVTREQIQGTGDNNATLDIYERDSTGLHLISTGDPNSTSVVFDGASDDGTHVFFDTDANVPSVGDTNNARDIYERDSTGLHLISTGDQSGFGATFRGASADGTRVLFETRQAIPNTGDNNNDTADIYERDSGGTLHLVSTGDRRGSDATFRGASADGTRVFFTTDEPIPGTGDNDANTDVYERDTTGFHLVSTGHAFASFAGASADGTHVFFTTDEAIPGTGDDDDGTDIYERDSDGTLQLVSTGDSVNLPAFFAGASADGTHVLFTTDEAIPGTGDDDIGTDIYERSPTAPAAPAPPPSTAPSVDRARPGVKILTPACPRKTSRKACANLRARARSWRTLHGTVTDPKPSSGIARVEINIVRTHGKRCSVYDGKKFVAISCRAAAKRYVRAKLGRSGRWTLALRTLPAGTYTIHARATDKAKHTTTTTRKLRLR